jgi:predicted GNAT family acetyltransferase
MTEATAERARHEPELHRFAIFRDDAAVAVLEYRPIDAATLDYHHTYVAPALRGRGLASELTAFALRYAVSHGQKVVPTCPFVAAFVKDHAEFQPVLAA